MSLHRKSTHRDRRHPSVGIYFDERRNSWDWMTSIDDDVDDVSRIEDTLLKLCNFVVMHV